MVDEALDRITGKGSHYVGHGKMESSHSIIECLYKYYHFLLID